MSVDAKDSRKDRLKSSLLAPIKALQYGALFSLIKALSVLPFGTLYALSDLLYFPLYHVFRYRRRIVRKNLTEAFPEKDLEEIKGIERKFYHFFADTTLETCKLISLTPEEIKQRIKFPNVETLNSQLRQGKSISLFIGHYGNWEWLSLLASELDKGAVSAQIYRTLRNKGANRLMKKMRERFGNVGVNMRETVRFMANSMSDPRPYIIGFIADQSPKRRESKHFLRFLNHNVPVLTGTEKATKHFGYQAVFVSARRIKRGYYEFYFTPLHDDPASLPDFELTSLYFKQLEKEIRRQPEDYLWSHNRFKYAQPDTEETTSTPLAK